MRKGDSGGKYQTSGEGGARLPPVMPHRLQNPKWPPGGPTMADGPGNVSILSFLGTPMRKVDDREKKKERKRK